LIKYENCCSLLENISVSYEIFYESQRELREITKNKEPDSLIVRGNENKKILKKRSVNENIIEFSRNLKFGIFYDALFTLEIIESENFPSFFSN
jgi:hypothetical protein